MQCTIKVINDSKLHPQINNLAAPLRTQTLSLYLYLAHDVKKMMSSTKPEVHN